ncbi:ANTAR domain-containing protein [Krasilnikoviella flava]|uniref:ANTAR domain-containing protein n=1 Tax=Krasilnikoviella flava TaxID=526729 RepID=A0A1T5IQG7_9MICO|nr:ANTAR domain-containing protein [Krasilnikoviella flava]SKC41355.1 ANTAR domain-containing protein [Krasilnikoviella flava]
MALSHYLDECAMRAATVLGHGVEASISLREHGISLRAGSSTPGAGRCDQAEARADTGPCIDAMRQGTVLTTAVPHDVPGWQAWRAAAEAEGFVQALAVPAEVGPGVRVAINVYSRAAGDWPAGLVDAAVGHAGLAADAVRLQLQFADLGDAVAGLYRTMSDRAAVEQAVGAIMASNDCPEEEARGTLRAAADRRGLSEREVAEAIVRTLVLGSAGDTIGDLDR